MSHSIGFFEFHRKMLFKLCQLLHSIHSDEGLRGDENDVDSSVWVGTYSIQHIDFSRLILFLIPSYSLLAVAALGDGKLAAAIIAIETVLM